MDYDELKEKIKDKFPIWASISSIIFGLASLFANFKDYLPVLLIGTMAVAGGGLFTWLILIVLRKNMLSKINPDYLLLSTEDVLELCDQQGAEALYVKKVKVKIKKDINDFYIFLPGTNGTTSAYRSYKSNAAGDKGQELPCSKVKYLNRNALFIHQPFKKHEELCFLFQWHIANGFTDREESISVKSEPYQECCKLKVISQCIAKASWSMYYGENYQAYLNGELAIQRVGDKCMIEYDYTPHLQKVHFKCAVNWERGQNG